MQLYPPEKPKWTIVDVILIVALVYFVMIFSGPLLSIISSFFSNNYNSYVVFVCAALFEYGIFIGFSMFIARIRGEKIKSLGFSSENLASNIVKGIMGGIVLLILITAASTIVNILIKTPIDDQYFTQIAVQADNWIKIMLVFLVGSVLAPVGEEIYFRGFAYPVLKSKMGKWPAMIVVSLFFAFMHLDLVRAIPLAIGGLGLVWLYEKSGSLYTSIIAHSIWNTIMTILVLL